VRPPGHQHHVDPRELVPLEVHRRDVLSRVAPLETIELGLLEAHGCVLARDVVAEADIPSFSNSAMDGYAVASGGLEAGATLDVVAEAAAGSPVTTRVGHGQAVRIMTGAPLPAGADAVVPVEVADEDAGRVTLRIRPEPGANVRAAGDDVRKGTVVLTAGRRLGPADVGMLAAVGRSRITVHPKPRVVVMSTGDELVDPDTPLTPGRIHDTNSFMLTAMAREAGAAAFRHGIVGDDRRALTEAFEGALISADLIITTGGVSAGRYDFVKDVLASMGDVKFRKVAMQPGMPQAFGFLGRGGQPVPCFGLPGNPVSAFVSFEIFVRPALRRLQGRADLNRPRVSAITDEAMVSPAHRVSFIRVKLRREADGWHASPTGAQGSHVLRSAVEADALAEIPADRTEVSPGETVVVHLLVSA
jgi:molybdopterin molybdotransferase